MQFPTRTCVVSHGMVYTYLELEQDANRLAHYMRGQGVRTGDRVGILLKPSYDTYVSILATMKAGATFVPLDQSFPAERNAFIAADAQIKLLITHASLARLGMSSGAYTPIEIDTCAARISTQCSDRPDIASDATRLCYIIYTSGTTGQPKGVGITNANYANYLAVVPPIYQLQSDDRVYQGLTIAFDFSLDEIFPTFMAGAALYTGSCDPSERVGAGLAQFLSAQGVTVLHGVPTLLATIEHDIPALRLIFLGGEVCPKDLASRWCRAGRRILNTYGPTETTITATWTEVAPDSAITIGRALPSYRVDLRDHQLLPVAHGTPGEICIAGPGVAQGYVNRPEHTADRFVTDPVDPSVRMYRTGDVGRLMPDGNIEFMGRIDTQVKIRGYRIELGEIETVLLEDPDVIGALVNPWQGDRDGDIVELVGYLVLREAVTLTDQKVAQLYKAIQTRLPPYMRPSYLMAMAAFPVMASGKADRSRLPAPASARYTASEDAAPLVSERGEDVIARIWRDIFKLQSVSHTADFFIDLGGHSLYAARAITRLRSVSGFEKVSIRDLYAHPTISMLALHLATTANAPHVDEATRQRQPMRRFIAQAWRIRLAGVLQVAALYVLLTMMGMPVIALSYFGTFGAAGTVGMAVSASMLALALSFVVPFVLKWAVIGRIKPGRYPLWGHYYLRFWLVQKALSLAPWYLISGTPVMNTYLRLLGCRIGRNCVLQTWCMPDLVGMGDNVSIGYNADVLAFDIAQGWLTLAPIRIGNDVCIGNSSMVNHGVHLGDESIVGEQAMVPPSMTVPPSAYWDGSPGAVLADRPAGYAPMAGALPSVSPGKRVMWSVAVVLAIPLLYLLPLVAALPAALILITTYRTFGWAAVVLAIIPAGLAFACAMCALLAILYRSIGRGTRAGMYAQCSAAGWRKWLADRLIHMSLLTTNALYATVYAKYWLRLIGVKVGSGAEVSTLSFFDPALLQLGQECFVADMASLGAATFHRGWYTTRATTIGARSFVGNSALVPAGTLMGNGALLGVLSKPPSERIEANASWLGAPAMYLPRRDVVTCFGEALTFKPSKVHLTLRYFIEFFRVAAPSGIVIATALGAGWLLEKFQAFGFVVTVVAIAPVLMSLAIAATVCVAGLKWVIIGRYKPDIKPLWSHFVWRSELITGLYENVVVLLLLNWLTGTPWFAFGLRLFGAKIGQGVCCETTFCSEFDLVEIGARAAIGRNVSLQTHLFEDRVMKMSVVHIGCDADVGSRTIVLYDAVLHDGCGIGSLSLILKGEEIRAEAVWAGIPASFIAGH